ncbi:hypothetical protein VTO42DRAFT_4876 [Malbranchea cinnamomea]
MLCHLIYQEFLCTTMCLVVLCFNEREKNQEYIIYDTLNTGYGLTTSPHRRDHCVVRCLFGGSSFRTV